MTRPILRLRNAPQRAALSKPTATLQAPRAAATNYTEADDLEQVIEAFNQNSEAVSAMADRLEQAEARAERATAMAEDLSSQLAAVRITGGAAGSFEDRRGLEAFANWARGVTASMSTDSDPDGGFLVPDTVEQQISRLVRDGSAVRQIARKRTITGAAYVENLWLPGAGSGWVTERQPRPETANDEVVELRTPVHEIYAMPKVSQQLLDDSRVDIAAELGASIADEFTDQEAAAFVNGDGVGKPRGFLSYPTSTARDAARQFGNIQYIASGDSSGFIAASAVESPVDCLIDVVASLKVGYRANATWLMNSQTQRLIRRMKDSEGRPAWEPSAKEGMPDRLLGYPIAIDENMPDVEADSFPIAFADWERAYLVVDRIGIRVLRDPFTAKPYVLFYTTKRVGGSLRDSNAIKLLKIAAS